MPRGTRRKRRMYPPEFHQQLIELVRAGRTPEGLSREFEPSGKTIGNWVAQAGRDCGARGVGLTSAEREERESPRRQVRQLRVEPDILGEAAAWFTRETGTIPNGSSKASGS